ncbi:hypothetical protein N7451_006301 [Penicillium sp. IBT 35674x]|nr:hypothetical protein N7451_006301 [Penicillium sp. IBT 35674x]
MSDSIVSLGSSIYYHNQTIYSALEKDINMTVHFQLSLVPGLEESPTPPVYLTIGRLSRLPDTVPEHLAIWKLYGMDLTGPYQADNFFNFTPANLVDNYPHDSLLTLISWVEGGHTPTFMVTTNSKTNPDPNTLFHSRKFCPHTIPTYLHHDVMMLTEVLQMNKIGKLDPDWYRHP